MALEGFWPADGEVRVSGCFVATVTRGDKDLVEVLVERGSLPKRCCADVGPKVRIRLPPARSLLQTRLSGAHRRITRLLAISPNLAPPPGPPGDIRPLSAGIRRLALL